MAKDAEISFHGFTASKWCACPHDSRLPIFQDSQGLLVSLQPHEGMACRAQRKA